MEICFSSTGGEKARSARSALRDVDELKVQRLTVSRLNAMVDVDCSPASDWRSSGDSVEVTPLRETFTIEILTEEVAYFSVVPVVNVKPSKETLDRVTRAFARASIMFAVFVFVSYSKKITEDMFKEPA